MLVTFGICFKQHFDVRYFGVLQSLTSQDVFAPGPSYSGNGPLYVTSSYSTWIFCKGVSGFASDCPCGVWCRELTTCLLHVGPPFWKSNFKQQLGCRFDIMDNISYFLVCVLTYAIVYVLIHWFIFRFYLPKYSFFKYSCTNIFHRCSLYTFYELSIKYIEANLIHIVRRNPLKKSICHDCLIHSNPYYIMRVVE